MVKLVKASAVDENGDELCPEKWNHDFIAATLKSMCFPLIIRMA